jgi:hypothetical protein
MTSYEKNFSDLLDDVKARFRGPAISIPTWEGYINEVYVKLQQTMRDYSDYDVSEPYSVSVIANTQEYPLPADFGIVRKVWRGDDNVQLEKGFFDNFLMQYVTSQSGYSKKYYLKGAHKITGTGEAQVEEFVKLGLMPVSSVNFQLWIVYQPLPHKLEDTSDVPNLPAQFCDLLTWGALVKAYSLEGMTEQKNETQKEFDKIYLDFKKWLGKDREAYDGVGFYNIYQRFIGR